jgi:hypothetical protein
LRFSFILSEPGKSRKPGASAQKRTPEAGALAVIEAREAAAVA